MPAVQGGDATVSSVGEGWLKKVLLLTRRWICVGAVPPIWAFHVVPEYSFTFWVIGASAHGNLTSCAAASAAESACIWRWRLCTNQLPTSTTNVRTTTR